MGFLQLASSLLLLANQPTNLQATKPTNTTTNKPVNKPFNKIILPY